MYTYINLTQKINQILPSEQITLLKQAASIAGEKNLQLYLVGGIVRDLLRGQPNDDLDLVVEGGAQEFARKFAARTGGKLTVHEMFNTAKVTFSDSTVDIAMARTETYAQPGALPVVAPGTIKTDLFRRDFTVNAMAVCVSPERYGELIDLYRGLQDLQNKLIRVLHEQSFVDDATRIWRAVRYEQRLDFQIEADTLNWLRRDVSGLKTVGGYRLRRELELVLKEDEPEKALTRLDMLGVLKALHPALTTDEQLVAKFQGARVDNRANADYYLGLLMAPLTETDLLQLTKYLRFSAQQNRIIKEVRESI
jgi:tRNA nucleotidyltransferase (CCA-adding enzyme)